MSIVPSDLARRCIDAVGEHDLDRVGGLFDTNLMPSSRVAAVTKTTGTAPLARLLPVLVRNDVLDRVAFAPVNLARCGSGHHRPDADARWHAGRLFWVTYRGVLLDFYGTVVEEDDAIVGGIVRAIVDAHPGRSEAELRRVWGETLEGLLASAHGEAFRTQREVCCESLDVVLRHANSAVDATGLCAEQFASWQSPELRWGSSEFVSSCPVPICVVSNIDRADIEAAIRHTGVPLVTLVTSEDVRSYKPRAEIFEAGLELLGLGPDEVLHIGDSLRSDVAGASALGIDVAWVDPKHREAPDARATHRISDLSEALPLLHR